MFIIESRQTLWQKVFVRSEDDMWVFERPHKKWRFYPMAAIVTIDDKR